MHNFKHLLHIRIFQFSQGKKKQGMVFFPRNSIKLMERYFQRACRKKTAVESFVIPGIPPIFASRYQAPKELFFSISDYVVEKVWDFWKWNWMIAFPRPTTMPSSYNIASRPEAILCEEKH